MSPNQTTLAEKSIRFSPLAAAQPLNILSWPEALNASRSKRACRMANSCNARSLPDFPEFAQAVRYGVPGTLAISQGTRTFAELLPGFVCDRVRLDGHAQTLGGGCERLVNARRSPVDDHDVGAVVAFTRRRMMPAARSLQFQNLSPVIRMRMFTL